MAKQLGAYSSATLLVLCLIDPAMAPPGNEFSSEVASFSVKFKDEISSYKVMSLFVLPKETITIQVLDDDGQQSFSVRNSNGTLIESSKNSWQWQAPSKKGLHSMDVIKMSSGETITLNAFVMVPYHQLKGEKLNGYRIGKYPSVPLKQLSIYKPPKGFIEVTKENEETLVSPHFKLKQFLCKQAGDYPKYVVLRARLLLKLELLLEKVNEKGYRCNTFSVMSGYRTPYYNKAIGNVKYSRHVWGGAADIFIDENPKDGMMDDLNHDGKIDYKDAAVVYEIVDNMYGTTWYKRFVGGLGRYKKTVNHGPFVHVDVRGFRARWGI